MYSGMMSKFFSSWADSEWRYKNENEQENMKENELVEPTLPTAMPKVST